MTFTQEEKEIIKQKILGTQKYLVLFSVFLTLKIMYFVGFYDWLFSHLPRTF
ncbi:hypothetical protein CDEF62S_02379 [Castellaniella defragrans]